MKKTINILLLAAFVMGLSSCSILTGGGNVLRGDQGEYNDRNSVQAVNVNKVKDEAPTISEESETAPIVTVSEVTAPVVTPATSSKPSKESSIKSSDANTPAPSKKGAQSHVANTFEGEWVIVQAGKHNIALDEDMPYINFDVNDGKFYASNGCNILNGEFKLVNDKELVLSNVLSTMRLCPDVAFEQDINQVLKDGNRLQMRIEVKGQESYLSLYQSGAKVMTLRKHNMEKLNGKWIVTDVEDLKIDNDEVNIFFDIPELLVHGNTGCNFFNGVIFIDAAQDNSISFAQMGVTMRLCENSNIETAMLVALEETTTYTLSGKNTLYLNNADGKRIITLKRAE